METVNKEFSVLDFEKPIAELESKIDGLKNITDSGDFNIVEEVSRLQKKMEKELKQIYSKLSPWQKTQVARHANRPHCKDYINALIEDFIPLAGDRNFADDQAMIGGIGRMNGQSVVVLGLEKGNDIETRIKHNFGMAKPEGYRKAIRLMELADRFGLPIITFVDTSGAYPGVDAEARGQAEAIARCTEKCLDVKVPIISCIIGEGGSGGAIAIATGNVVLMMEHAIYSVISPEGCASILWRAGEEAKQAAEALKLTAQDLEKLGVIDEIVKEPLGGAHRNPVEAMNNLRKSIEKQITRLTPMKGGALKSRRREKFIKMGRNL